MFSDLNDKMAQRATKHRLRPEPGDYWHEMFVPIMVVVAVEDERIAICDKVVNVSEDSWTWAFDAARWISHQELANRPLYSKGEPNHHMGDKCWCDVAPRSHFDLLKHFRDILPQAVPIDPVCYLWSA